MPVNFMISEGRSYARVGGLSCGGWGFMSPSIF